MPSVAGKSSFSASADELAEPEIKTLKDWLHGKAGIREAKAQQFAEILVRKLR